MKTVKISIIVPIYNVEKYLYQCLESIRVQTLKEIEVICVNDGSSDSSAQIIHSFAEKDNRFIVIDKENTGYGDSVNQGIKEANGEYIGIVESDDFVNNDMFEILYDNAKRTGAEVVKANFNIYRENTKNHIEFCEILSQCPYNEIFSSESNNEIFNVQNSVWSAIYKRDFLVTNNIFFLNTPGAAYQDISFTFKVIQKASKIYCVRDAVINYRVDNADSSVNSPSKINCVCDEFNEIENYIKQQDPDKQTPLFPIMEYIKFKAYLWNYNRLALPYQYYFLNEIYEDFTIAIREEKINKEYFLSEEWDTLHIILDNKDSFFQETCKDYYDKRVALMPVLNRKFEFDAFQMYISRYERIYIYGAGQIGHRVFEFFSKRDLLYKLKGFLVSSMEHNPEQIEGKKVFDLAIADMTLENVLIIVAVQQNRQYEIVKALERKDVENTILITPHILNAIKEL